MHAAISSPSRARRVCTPTSASRMNLHTRQPLGFTLSPYLCWSRVVSTAAVCMDCMCRVPQHATPAGACGRSGKLREWESVPDQPICEDTSYCIFPHGGSCIRSATIGSSKAILHTVPHVGLWAVMSRPAKYSPRRMGHA